MTGIDIGMFGVAAGAFERVPPTHAELAALAAALRRESRIGVVDAYAEPLRLIHASLRQLVEEPLRQLAAGTCTLFTTFPDLLDTQVLKDKHGVIRSPFAELCRSLFTECQISIGLLTTQPFQKSTHTARILFLCLPVGQLALQPLAGLAGSPVLDSITKTGDEQCFIFRGGNQRIGRAEVDADRGVADGFGDFEGEAEGYLAGAGNGDAVVAYSVIEVGFSVGRDYKVQFLSPYCSGYGEFAFNKTEVFSEQEQRHLPFK